MAKIADIKAVIFDFDGTLVDSAPDLVAALNVLRARRGLLPVEARSITTLVANGSRAMMREFLLRDGDDMEELRQQFLAAYDSTNHQRTKLFAGIESMLGRLEQHGVVWAIVTNKPKAQTETLLTVLNLQRRVAQLVCGDTLSRAKPHPDGLLKVCEQLALQPQKCLYVGDNLIDRQAAESCAMPFAAAGWGYWYERDTTAKVLNAPDEILPMLGAG